MCTLNIWHITHWNCPPVYHQNGFGATQALCHMIHVMYTELLSFTSKPFSNVRLYMHMYNFYCICKVLLVYDVINLYLEQTFFFHINAFRAEVKKEEENNTVSGQILYLSSNLVNNLLQEFTILTQNHIRKTIWTFFWNLETSELPLFVLFFQAVGLLPHYCFLGYC